MQTTSLMLKAMQEKKPLLEEWPNLFSWKLSVTILFSLGDILKSCVTKDNRSSKGIQGTQQVFLDFLFKKTGSHNYYNVYGKKHTENVGQRLLEFLEFEVRGTRVPGGK